MVLDEIKEQLKASMKKGDKKNVLAIRNILEKIKNVQVDSKEELKENQIIKIIAKHAKQLRESIIQFEKGNRLDLAEKEQEELNLDDFSKNILSEINATQMSDMGKVMKAVIDKTKGNADGKLISTLVRESLI